MKRLHLSLGVADLDTSVAFYNAFFRAQPTVLKPDYAKWMLDDPRVNFVVHTRGTVGLDHLGVQVDAAGELDAVTQQLAAAELAALRQTDAACCYARSDKAWVADPDGNAWEAFFTHGQTDTHGDDTLALDRLRPARAAAGASMAGDGACCGPRAETAPSAASAASASSGGACCGPRTGA